MSDESARRIEDRLHRIERRLEIMEYRLQAAEARRGVESVQEVEASVRSGPPPVVFDAAPSQPAPDRGYYVQPPPPPLPAPRERQEDAEYRIGAQLMPRVGAAAVIAGIGYLVSLGYTRGFITPAMLFWFGVILCASFIAIGMLKLDEKEEFGQVLTAVGSCGLYVTFAAGHIFQKLYDGEMLVILFLALSFMNLAFSQWRTSRTFLAIGVIGGLAAALMPLDQDNIRLNLILHFAIIVPAAWIASRNRWLTPVLWLHGLSLLALVPAILSREDWMLRVGAVYANALVGLAAYAFAYERRDWDEHSVLAPVGLFVAGLIGLGIQHEPVGAMHLLVFGAAIAPLALIREDLRSRFLVAAAGIPLVLAPCCFSPLASSATFAGFAVVCAGASLSFARRAASVFAAIELGLGVLAYLVASDQAMPWRTEVALLAGLIAAAAASAYALSKAWAHAEGFVLGATLLILPLFARTVGVSFTLPAVNATLVFSVASALLMYSLILSAIALVSGWRSTAVLSSLVALASFGFYLASAAETRHALLAELSVAAGIAVALCAGAAANRKHAGDWISVVATSATLIGALFLRLAFLVLTQPLFGLAGFHALAYAAIAYSAVCFALFWRDRAAFGVPGWLFWAAASGFYLLMAFDGDPGASAQIWVVALLLALLVAGSTLSDSASQSPREIRSFEALVGWALFSRLTYLIFTLPAIGMNSTAAVTLGWTLYALILLVLGFALHVREMRYVSFAVLACTIGKVMLVDLATVDPGIRVGVLMALGLTMIGGGYWYIRSRESFLTTNGPGPS